MNKLKLKVQLNSEFLYKNENINTMIINIKQIKMILNLVTKMITTTIEYY